MNKLLRNGLLFAIIVIVFMAQCLAANSWNLGQYNFVNGVSSGPLKATMNGQRGLSSYGFVGSVGGVAFESVASPDSSFQNRPITISYNPSNEDGNRLIISMNNTDYHPYLPDWQLIPIARYADSEYNACVSLFGPKTTQTSYDIIYHQAFENTLLGLRLLQADILLMDLDEFRQLPKYNNQTILGLGETMPDGEGWRDSAEEIYRIMGEDVFQSWVCTDCNQEVQFLIENKQFIIRGLPYYYFWRADFDTYNKRFAQYKKQADAYRQKNLIKEYNQIVTKINSLEPEVIEVTSLTNAIKANIETLQSVNPIVYSAVNQTMRFAAFFRYLKGSNLDMWTEFLNQLRDVQVNPKIKTPTQWKKPTH